MARTLLLAFALFFNHAYAMIQLKDFYPYGLKNGDRNQTRRNDDQFDGPLKLKVPYPFFSGVYQSLYVNTNGAVSFKKGIRQYTPEAFPLNDTMLTPFWADVDTRNWGQIYFRETQDPALLLRASKEIQDIFLTHMDFTARSLYITTWYDVTYYGGNNATSVYDF
ncbi:sushi, nidogen and EGF-like domain-containing protein 1 [Lingula anatina]|uniref:Sushi, nidogen and EGF-like domain-containing protein 1 n=1 Tax=Lingula anatina TaxID=7574 RepID=A0A1S3K5C7_LINAN|nr:sushi, nidogen and EGF-like domain-containing protein 1 [Lingula anatina]|eukprot:XP_013417624.1 sushi, nidogen and EGF-like domain-containing protein 1 [Lingula anatina]